MSDNLKPLSKFLSLVLRHKPETIGVQLDDAGWIDVSELLAACGKHGKQISQEQLALIVETSDKQRFAFNEDRSRIRASQGHSLDVDLGYCAQTPPPRLYHGTASRFVESIKASGLIKGKRHHVHLTTNQDTARTVGGRYGSPVILTIDAGAMHAEGTEFFVSDNGVWLTDHVPARFIKFGD